MYITLALGWIQTVLELSTHLDSLVLAFSKLKAICQDFVGIPERCFLPFLFPFPVSLNIAVPERMGEEWVYLFCIKQNIVCLNVGVAEIQEKVLNVLVDTLN